MDNALIPELSVSDWKASCRFYCDILGFSVVYDRAEEGFAFLALGEAQLMIDQIGVGRDFDLLDVPRLYPFGRGMNLQIEVPALDPILARLADHGIPLYLNPEENGIAVAISKSAIGSSWSRIRTDISCGCSRIWGHDQSTSSCISCRHS
jgi:catechol 2,3-dioxygenase-like lactoylglutathione lyase family enzyme